MSERVAAVERVGLEVARKAASDVDARARFPHETLAALRDAGVLRAAVPGELGGGGADIVELVECCAALGQHCGSSAMVLAMHYIQVLCIARHRGDRPELEDYLRAVAREQRLLASVTSEVGPSGDMRRSIAAVHTHGAYFDLEKKATTLSYGQHADDLLITARRHPEAAPGDQVLVLAFKSSYGLSELGAWDTLGMRGTCSPSMTVKCTGAAWQVLPETFGDIATYTMVPASHLLWSAVWLGLATDAVSIARASVRTKARAEPGRVPRAAQRLTDVVARLQLMHDEVYTLAREYSELVHTRDQERLASLAFALRINNLKLSTSKMVVEIIGEALSICGIEAYKNDSSSSLGRHLRDAYSAALMINNDRIYETNASLLLVHKGT